MVAEFDHVLQDDDMTYSIVAHDPTTGEIGVAIQSYYYGCGVRTISARPGVGVVAAQMIPDPLYTDEGLLRLAERVAPNIVIDGLTSEDPGCDSRQVAMVDVQGRVAAFTGQGCVAESGHILGNGCSAQGAMVESPRVWERMMEAYRDSTGPLAERLVSALRAGEAAGGDVRGRRAAALLVVATHESTSWPESRPFNIRVDDHADPLTELERHLVLQRSMNAIETGFVKGLMGDVPGAISAYEQLSAAMPEDPDIAMRYAVLLGMTGEIDKARDQLVKMSNVHAGWAKLPARLIESRLLPDDPRLRAL